MTRLWRVDRIHSHLMGQALRGLTITDLPRPAAKRRVLSIWTELVFTAICHQTNWDRLHDTVCGIAETCDDAISPERLQLLDGPGFISTFGPGIDSDRLRLRERLELLRDIGEKASDWPRGADASWASADSVTLSGDGGLYAWLKRFKAFGQDPLEKKARVFVHQLLRLGLITVSDPNHIAPAVDYHLSRYYVRTGRVIPLNEDITKRLLPDQPARVEFHTHLRRAVEEAMFYTSSGAAMRMDLVNHFEWQIARSFCTRKLARCEGEPLEEKPLDESLRVLHEMHGNCPMFQDCRGARDAALRCLVDPRSAREYY
jgi:hypothetical protein